MNILVNFGTLKSGGGQNVALNFLLAFQNLQIQNINFTFIVAKDSEPHKYLVDLGYENFYVFPRNPIKRILYEFFKSRKIINKYNIDIIYSYFGFGLFPKLVPQVCGSADSNLYFPDVDFWNDYNGLKLLLKKAIDQYRIFGLKNCAGVVFENHLMEKKGRELFFLQQTAYIKPSIKLIGAAQVLENRLEDRPLTGLFLCGWQLNKNIMIIPEILSELKKRGLSLTIILTAPDNGCSIQKRFMQKLKAFGVEDRVKIIGIVNKEQLPQLYSSATFVFLLSKLESFSNNIIEAWQFEKPLIVADEEWSRSICNNGAQYVDRDSPEDIAMCVIKLIEDKELKNSTINRGKAMLSTYPDIEERITLEVEFLRSIACVN